MKIKISLIFGIIIPLIGVYILYQNFYGYAFSTLTTGVNPETVSRIDWTQVAIGTIFGMIGNLIIGIALQSNKVGKRRGKK